MDTQSIGRREFLTNSGATALTTSLFTGNLRGANDKIAAAFVGVGVMGSENLKAAMRQPGVQAAAVCDVYQPNLERAAAIARRQGHQPKEVKDFREILADKSIDVVCISTPDHWHPY
ncbi:MAG: Gfo/Idh/MocA family oxidoreductase, partial [Acidobacteria bacterium]|nr:Gfo/Idh/MocA family oxidoreductase [Acidobacteriota bacterium]